MPPRPSRNLDLALLAAGRELLAHRGCAGLSVREVAEAAGVNLGMFHYHFKSREAFLRTLLQSMYDGMYSQLSFEADPRLGPREALRSALRFMARFVRANRPVLARIIADALCGDPIATEFMRNNFPRHLGLILGLIELGQAQGLLKPMSPAQALGICAGGIAMPILAAGAIVDAGAPGAPGSKAISTALLTDAALDQRVELLLAAITQGANAAPAKKRARAPRGKPR